MQNKTENSIFDRSILLTRLDNDENFLKELLDAFLEDAQTKLKEMKMHLIEGDLDAILFIAHSLKGSSGNLAAISMQEAVRQLENAGKRGDLKMVTAYFKVVESEYKKLRKFLNN